jgi:hypothetical protein
MSDSFLSRWSRRKIEDRAQEKQGVVKSLQTGSDVLQPTAVTALKGEGEGAVVSTADSTHPKAAAPEVPVPLPTEADLKGVEQGGDIKAFLVDKVTPELKNKAFRALFSRPEFNVMDGLDIYIDDYNKFTPLSQADIGKMSMSKQLLSRPDLEVPEPDLAVALPKPLEDCPKELSTPEGIETDPGEDTEHAAFSVPAPEVHNDIMENPDATQAADIKAFLENRSFEKKGGSST